MDRGNILVVAVIVAALAFFCLQFLSAPGDPSSTEFSRSGAQQEGWVAEEDAGSGDLRGGSARSGERRGSGSPRQRLRQRLAGNSSAAGAGSSHSGRRSAETIQGGRSLRGGKVGTSVSTRREGGNSISIAGTGEGGPASGRLGGRAREDLVQTLALKPPPSGGLFESDEPGALDGEDEAVLEVTSTEDTDKAEKNTDVHDPKYGDDGIEMTPDSELAFPNAGNVNGAAGSISMEISPNWAGGEETNNTLAQIRRSNDWNNSLELVKNGKYLRFIIRDNTGVETDISYMINSWAPGERHEVTPTWGDGEMKLYVDGQMVDSKKLPGQFDVPSGTPMQLGSAFANYQGFDGIIHKTTVWGRARSADEVASGY